MDNISVNIAGKDLGQCSPEQKKHQPYHQPKYYLGSSAENWLSINQLRPWPSTHMLLTYLLVIAIISINGQVIVNAMYIVSISSKFLYHHDLNVIKITSSFKNISISVPSQHQYLIIHKITCSMN